MFLGALMFKNVISELLVYIYIYICITPFGKSLQFIFNRLRRFHVDAGGVKEKET